MSKNQMHEAYIFHFAFGASWELTAIMIGVDLELLISHFNNSLKAGFSAFDGASK